MVDVLTPEQRQLNMSRIRGHNTRPEMLLRRGLHGRGLRFRIHRRDLPGCPDLVLSRFRAVIFVHGCFWHGHKCPMFKMPTTRTAFWRAKIDQNIRRDNEARVKLLSERWRVMVVWECALRGKGRIPVGDVLDAVVAWLETDAAEGVIRGQ